MTQASSQHKGIDEPLLGLESCPSVPISALAGAQHLLASLAGIIAPTLIITSALSLGAYTASLLSMALVVSGIATWIQSQRLGPFGSGLLSIQGTSFSFVSALITAGLIARSQNASDEQVLAVLFGTCLAGSLIGGLPETQDMIDFCAENDITATVEVISADQVDEYYDKVVDGDVRYRAVIDTETLAS